MTLYAQSVRYTLESSFILSAYSMRRVCESVRHERIVILCAKSVRRDTVLQEYALHSYEDMCVALSGGVPLSICILHGKSMCHARRVILCETSVIHTLERSCMLTYFMCVIAVPPHTFMR